MATFGNLETGVEPIAGLMRDHVEVHGLVTETRDALEAGLGDSSLTHTAIEAVRDLAAYLAEDMVIHIAKEEEVLFPALRGFAASFDQVVDEMVEQHDEVRLRKANIERALAHMDESHAELQGEIAGITTTSARPDTELASAETLAGLLDAVKRLDWILQGHFGDEEDDLFPPALELLSAETFADLARQAAALEA